jgi:hypothetical protein
MSKTTSNTGHSGHNFILNHIIQRNTVPSALPIMSAIESSGQPPNQARQKPLLQGTLYKLRKRGSRKQKYFVIFDDAPDQPGTARLEYFDSEKKFYSAMKKSADNGVTDPKRSIVLCSCFNINKRIDVQRYRYVIGLYRKDDIFSIIMKDDEELNQWLKQLLILQRGRELLDGDQPRPTFGE